MKKFDLDLVQSVDKTLHSLQINCQHSDPADLVKEIEELRVKLRSVLSIAVDQSIFITSLESILENAVTFTSCLADCRDELEKLEYSLDGLEQMKYV